MILGNPIPKQRPSAGVRFLSPRRQDDKMISWGDPRLGKLLLRLHGAREIDQFWTALQALLSAAIPYDALAVYLNFYDFSQSWKAAKILTTPNAERSTPWFEGRRRVDMTPKYVLGQPKRIKCYRLSDVIPNPKALSRTTFFKEYFAAHGWHHAAVSLYWRGATVGSEIALRRTRSQGDFSSAEIHSLEALYPHIETVISRLLALQEERARRHALENFNQHLAFALIFLNWDLTPIFVNQTAYSECAHWNYGVCQHSASHARTVFSLPREIVDACTILKSLWLERETMQLGNMGPCAVTKVVHPTRPELSAGISLQLSDRYPMAHPGFVVNINSEGRASTGAFQPVHPRMTALSRAEQELARQLSRGLGNSEIAALLGKSVATIKKQLTSVYRKTGATSRCRFMAALVR